MMSLLPFYEARILALSLAASLRSEDGVAKKILDFFWLDVRDGKICSKATGGSLFGIHDVQDEAHAAAFLMCLFPIVMSFNPKSRRLERVSNPFYMKSVDEAKVILDLQGC